MKNENNRSTINILDFIPVRGLGLGYKCCQVKNKILLWQILTDQKYKIVSVKE